MTAVQAPTDTPETEAPECRQHGPMVLRPAGTPEQEFTGDWYTCPDPTCRNAILRPSPELLAQLAEQQQKRGTVTIAHTRADGTLLEGSRKGDGVWEIVRQHGFRSSRNIGLYISHSRDRAAKRWNIDRAAEALRKAGWTVVIDIDEDTRRTFAEAEGERVERAADRAERFEGYTDNAASRSAGRYKAAMDGIRGIEPGQPILVDHYSARSHRRALERHDNNMRASIAEQSKAEHWAARAKASGSYEQFRNSPGRTLRRLEKLRAELRGIERWQRGESNNGHTVALTPARVAELERRNAETTEEIEFWEHVIAEAEKNGFKVWSKADFTKGDFVLYGGTWYEVLRANAKSVTIPHIHNGTGKKVVRKGDGHVADWTWTAPYTDVRGRRSAEEQAAAESVTDPGEGDA